MWKHRATVPEPLEDITSKQRQRQAEILRHLRATGIIQSDERTSGGMAYSIPNDRYTNFYTTRSKVPLIPERFRTWDKPTVNIDYEEKMRRAAVNREEYLYKQGARSRFYDTNRQRVLQILEKEKELQLLQMDETRNKEEEAKRRKREEKMARKRLRRKYTDFEFPN